MPYCIGDLKRDPNLENYPDIVGTGSGWIVVELHPSNPQEESWQCSVVARPIHQTTSSCRMGFEVVGAHGFLALGLSTRAQKRLTFSIIEGLYKAQKVKGYLLRPDEVLGAHGLLGSPREPNTPELRNIP